jgi:very-short-patch-repair endonuclease
LSESTPDAPATCPVEIDVTARPVVNFAAQQHGSAIVDSITLTNTSDEPVVDLTVTVSLANGSGDPWISRIDRIAAHGSYTLDPVTFSVTGERLAAQTERERTELQIQLSAGGVVPARHTAPIDVLAANEWGGSRVLPELLASFVLPNHPALAPVLVRAGELLAEVTSPGLDGYQSKDPDRIRRIVEAGYVALLERGIGYINPPASFETEGQRVRLADEVLGTRLGTCLDLAVLLSAVWEQCGLHPVIVLTEGHAVAGVWTHQEHFAQPVVDGGLAARKRVELDEMLLVEATCLTHGADGGFTRAVTAGTDRIARASGFVQVIDVRSARKFGVRPLPIKADRTCVDDVKETKFELSPVGHIDDVHGPEDGNASPAGADSRAPEPFHVEQDRLSRWKRRLLDLSLRNRLINFRATRRTVPLLVADPSAVEDRLATGTSLELVQRPDRLPEGEDQAGLDAFLAGELRSGRVFADLTPAETERRGTELFRDARASLNETGANLLHLAIGTLVWYEHGSSEPREAPLLLIPVRLERPGAGRPLRVTLADDPARSNAPLLEKLRTEFGVQIPGLEELPEDDAGLDVAAVLRTVREAVRDIDRWEVRDTATLGLFSFNRFLMWRDLEERTDDLRQSPLVRRLIDARDDQVPHEAPEAFGNADDELPPGEPLCTRDADSSQLDAMRAVRSGETFVLQGPPGTGKSQTIANIIADALGRGERVLFVAEKRAALTVVRRRLEQDGLGPFCLELHSNRASKREVLDQIKEPLELAAVSEPSEWETVCAKLGSARERVNGYLRELHAPRESGESIREVIARLADLGDGPAAGPDGFDPSAVTPEVLASWRDALRALIDAARVAGGDRAAVAEHALRGVGLTQFGFGVPDEGRAAIASVLGTIESLRVTLAAWFTGHGVRHAASITETLDERTVRWVGEADDLMRRCPGVPRGLVTWDDDAVPLADLGSWVDRGRDRDRRRAALLSRYDAAIFELPLSVLSATSRRVASKRGLAKWWGMRGVRAALKSVAIERAPGSDAAAADIEEARGIAEESRALSSADDPTRAFGRLWAGGEADWDELAARLDWACAFRDLVRSATPCVHEADVIGALESASSEPAASVDDRSVAAVIAEFTDARETLASVLDVRWDVVPPASEREGYLPWLSDVLARWRGSLGDLPDWCAWQSSVRTARERGLGEVVDLVESGRTRADDASDVFERGYGSIWLRAAADDVEEIRSFSGRGHAAAIRRFRELDERVIALTRDLIAARLAAGVPRPSGGVSTQSEVGVLLRELEKRRRHLPIRRLIERVPRTMALLKPCFLMSPLSVAQYLDPALPPFDLVVFDEASQIPPWEAVGAIARGTRVVVVGDSKQLPPTTFFDKSEEADDDATASEVEELESILQECVASGVPARRLLWHYRSRHESLIAFSNRHYYNGRLRTFPSPVEAGGDLGVSLRRVDGVYDRGSTRTNRAEAEAVVNEVVTILRRGTGETIGVVTFNMAQQVLIEDLLDERCKGDPELERLVALGGEAGDEPVFIKNLESVQGDERDVILFSITYGPDEDGRVSMNFGPLNRDGGERRLNVAVTRARRRVIVFASMDPSQIDPSRSDRVGVRHLRWFLEYAEGSPEAVPGLGGAGIGATSSCDGVVSQVAASLRSEGHDVEERVGVGGYRVDLAVRDPDDATRYLLGIEFDGVNYVEAATARDRDRICASVMEGLGWTLARVWAVEWRLNPDGVLRSLSRSITEARRAARRRAEHGSAGDEDGETVEVVADAPNTIASLAEPAVVSDAALGPEGPPVYTPWSGDPVGTRDELLDPANSRLGRDTLRRIVEAEQPIMPSIAERRLADAFGVDRFTGKVSERCATLVKEALDRGLVQVDGDALWGRKSERVIDEPRVPGEDVSSRRAIESVPLAERVAAVRVVLAAQVCLPERELVKHAARVLGYQRVSGRAEEALDAAVREAVARGWASEDGDEITLAES